MTPKRACRTITILAISIVVAGVMPACTADEVRSGFTLEALEHGLTAWHETGRTPVGFPFDLNRLSFVWRASPGDGSEVVAVSRYHSGYVLLFGQNGELSDLTETGQIYYSMFLCDLDQDRVAEVIVDELSGTGTGVLIREFEVFSIKDGSLANLGSLTSYDTTPVPRPPDRSLGSYVTKGYVRCNPGDGMEPPSLDYLQEERDETGSILRSRRSSFEVQDGALVERQQESN